MLNGLPALALIVKLEDLLPVMISAIVFVLIGLIVFGSAFFIIVKVAPFSVRKEIEDDQNIALGIVIGAVILGVAIIIAAAING